MTFDIGPHLTAVALLSLVAVVGLRVHSRHQRGGTNRARTPQDASSPARHARTPSRRRPGAERGWPEPSPAAPETPDPVAIICGLLAERYGVAADALTAPCRTQPATQARQVAMRLARELLGMSYPAIGARFGRDHTTVLHAMSATEGMMLGDLREAACEALGVEPPDIAARAPTPLPSRSSGGVTLLPRVRTRRR